MESLSVHGQQSQAEMARQQLAQQKYRKFERIPSFSQFLEDCEPDREMSPTVSLPSTPYATAPSTPAPPSFTSPSSYDLESRIIQLEKTVAKFTSVVESLTSIVSSLKRKRSGEGMTVVRRNGQMSKRVVIISDDEE